MNSNNQNSGLQKRMIIMTVLVFVFFIAYEFLVLKPKQIEKMEQQKIEQEQMRVKILLLQSKQRKIL